MERARRRAGSAWRKGLYIAGGSAGALALAAGLTAGAAYVAERRRERYGAQEAATEGAFVDVDGWNTHYVAHGHGPALLLLHGFLAHTYTWRHNVEALSQHFRVYALDLPGGGYSERPRRVDEYQLARHAEHVRGFMDAMHIARAHVVGNSMGGALALRLAYDFPERINKLVLEDAPAYGLVQPVYGGLLHTPLVGRTALNLWLLRRPTARMILRAIYAAPNPELRSEEAVSGYLRPYQVKGTTDALLAMTRALTDKDLTEIVPRITRPTLIISGEEDRIISPKQSQRMAREIPDARLVLLPGVGHMPHEEDSDRFNQLVLNFLLE